MTCEEAIKFYKMIHSQIVRFNGEDWFVNVSVFPNTKCNVEETLKDIERDGNLRKIIGYRYYIRPAYSSIVGPINPLKSSYEN